jgi:4-diphosphocytidyl-2-C-methyl-D-erythritol kinase
VKRLRVRCFGKINTVLLVTGRRPDGYHELDTEFVSIALSDDLEIAGSADGFTLVVEGASPADVPVHDNLVVRAARALQGEVGAERLPGASFRLVKRIPSAAGLGGGSSDAAGALEGLDRLFDLDVPRERLEALALAVGSDVPYFLRGGRQRGQGRGEILTELPDRPDQPVVLLKPRLALSTALVFRTHAERASAGLHGTDIGALTRRKTSRSLISTSWWRAPDVVVHDDLADAAVQLAPDVAEVAAAAERAFPDGIVGMTGSGPTVFVLLPGGAEAGGRLRELEPLADAWLTRTVGGREYRSSRFG